MGGTRSVGLIEVRNKGVKKSCRDMQGAERNPWGGGGMGGTQNLILMKKMWTTEGTWQDSFEKKLGGKAARRQGRGVF